MVVSAGLMLLGLDGFRRAADTFPLAGPAVLFIAISGIGVLGARARKPQFVRR
jgi:hypothetical protein